MGDPKKQRKKYSTPSHPWNEARIKAEKITTKEYGLKNKKEIWKAESFLRKIKSQTKKLITRTDEQSKKEEKQLINKLVGLNLIDKNAKLQDILTLTMNDVNNRRLQTLVFRKGLARSVNQARQFIVHGHINVGDKKINVPSYLVKTDEENKINYNSRSAFANKDHPEIKKEEVVIGK